MIKFLSYVITDMIMSFVMLYCYSKMSLKNFKITKIVFIIILFTSIITITNNLYNVISLKIPVSFIIFLIINKTIFKTKFKETIIYTSMYYIIAYLLELILSIILLLFISDTINQINNSILLKISISLIHVLITYLVFKNKRFVSFINKINKSINENLLTFIFIILFMLNIISIFRYNSIVSTSLINLIIIVIIFIIISLKIFINNKYNIAILTEKNNSLKDSFKAYSETIEECRTFKHNIKNELYAIKSILPKEQQNILNNIIKKYNSNYEWITTIYDLPEGLQGIIYLKKNEARKYKIFININSNKKINVNENDYIDMSNILGIILDNAIEATKNAQHKIIDINLEQKDSKLNISIKNKFNNSIDLKKIGEKNYSTKIKKSGLGLNYIKKLKNTKIDIKYSVIGDIFITDVVYINKISYKKRINRKDT